MLASDLASFMRAASFFSSFLVSLDTYESICDTAVAAVIYFLLEKIIQSSRTARRDAMSETAALFALPLPPWRFPDPLKLS